MGKPLTDIEKLLFSTEEPFTEKQGENDGSPLTDSSMMLSAASEVEEESKLMDHISSAISASATSTSILSGDECGYFSSGPVPGEERKTLRGMQVEPQDYSITKGFNISIPVEEKATFKKKFATVTPKQVTSTSSISDVLKISPSGPDSMA